MAAGERMVGLGLASEVLFHGSNPRCYEVTAVVVGPSAKHVAVDHAGFVDVDAAADFEVELAFGDGCHAEAVNDACAGGDFDAVADAGHRKTFLPEPAGDAEEIFVFADVFRGTSAAEEDADIVLGVDVFKGDIGFNGVALPFFGDGPARFDFVEDHLVAALFGGGDDGLEAGFDEAVKRVEGINGFSGVADDHENFWFIHGMAGNKPFLRRGRESAVSGGGRWVSRGCDVCVMGVSLSEVSVFP
ncbi:MAG: hypothetical protein RIS92_2539 [Verrucomicrobiota bacterium]